MALDGSGLALLMAAAGLDRGPAAGPETLRMKRTLQIANARASKRLKQVSRQLEEARDAAARRSMELAVCQVTSTTSAAVLPRGSEVRGDAGSFLKMWAMQRVACSPRIRGPGAVKQNMGFQLLASGALAMQREAFDHMVTCAAHAKGHTLEGGMLQTPAPAPTDGEKLEIEATGVRTAAIMGMRLMWDEAGQKLRPLLRHAVATGQCLVKPGAQTTLQVMSLCCELFCVCSREDLGSSTYMSVERWEPWLTPPRILANTTTPLILEALARSMPFPVDQLARRDAVLAGVDCFVLVLMCDSASSNMKSLRWFAEHARLAGPKFLFFPEVCSVHQLHIVKSSCLDLVGLAGCLFSFSKLVRMNSTLDVLMQSIRAVVQKKAVLRQGGRPAGSPDFLKLIFQVYHIDGDESFLFRTTAAGKKVPTTCLSLLQSLASIAVFEPGGRIVMYTNDVRVVANGHKSQRDEAIQILLHPLFDLFIHKSWPIAALSRWTHNMDNLKRLILGTIAGNILPEAVAMMSSKMNIDAQSVEAKLAKASRIEEEGGEADSLKMRALHGKRVLRVAGYFSDLAVNGWRLGIILIATSIPDRMHYNITGIGRSKASLSDMVDPRKSIIGTALDMVTELMSDFRIDDRDENRWGILLRMGGNEAEQMEVRLFARRLLAQVSCGIFRRLEIRMSTPVYKLQWLLMAETTDADKQYLCDLLLRQPEHCQPVFLRRFLKLCPTRIDILGHKGAEIVRVLQSSLLFSTHEVEVQHAHFKRTSKSDGQGKHHNVAVNADLCRQIREVHLRRGGADPATCKATPAKLLRHRPSWGLPFLAAPPLPRPSGTAEDQTGAPQGGGDAAANSRRRPGRKPTSTARRPKHKFRGNPKLAFVNNKLSTIQQSLTKSQWVTLRDRFSKEYDMLKADEKARWLRIFRNQGCRRRCGPAGTSKRGRARLAAGHLCAAVASSDAQQNRFTPTWSGSAPGDAFIEQSPALPLSEIGLAKHFKDRYGTFSKLRSECGGESPFTINESDMSPERSALLDKLGECSEAMQHKLLWGCGGCLHNVCSERRVGLMAVLLTRLSSWADSIGKDAHSEVNTVIACIGEKVGGEPDERLTMFLLLGTVLLNPKVQTFVLCKPQPDDDNGDVFCRGMLAFPMDLHVQRRWSRLSSPTNQRFKTLSHLTSDEVALHMVEADLDGDVQWHAHLVKQSLRIDVDSLLVMRADAIHEDGWLLSAKVKGAKVSKGAEKKFDGVLAEFFAMSFGALVAGARGAEHGGSSDPHALSGMGLMDVGHASGDEAAQKMGEEMEEPKRQAEEEDSPGDPEGVMDPGAYIGRDAVEDIAAAAADSLRGDGAEGDEVGGERSEEHFDEVSSPSHAQGPVAVDDVEATDAQACTEAALQDIVAETVEPEQMLEACLASSSTSLAAQPSAPPGATSREGCTFGGFVVGDGGYVIAAAGGRIIGRLTKFRNNASMACWRHSNCRIIRSSNRYTDSYLLEWLVRGEDTQPTASAQERRQAGERHKAAFRNL